jgi:hypothetical protein
MNTDTGTPMQVLPLFLASNAVDELEGELITALYEQRSLEHEIMKYEPQTSAPQELRSAFCSARVKVNRIELRIRMMKHSF